MKTLLQQQLDTHGATIQHNDEGHGFKLIGASGRVYGMFPAIEDPADPQSLVELSVPAWVGWHALKSIVEVDSEITKVGRNQRLSAFGREQELLNVKSSAVLGIAFSNNSLNNYEQQVRSEEVARYAVPVINPNDFAGVMRDTEVRNAIRAMPREEQLQLMKTLNNGDDEQMIASLLRSPVRFAELEQFARQGWKDLVDTRDPVGRASLDHRHKTIDWSKRVIGMTVAMVKPMINFTQEQLYTVSKPQNGAELFGLTSHEIVYFERKFSAQST
jgi:hypothetical protein